MTNWKSAVNLAAHLLAVPLVLYVVSDLWAKNNPDTRHPIERWGKVEALNSPIRAGQWLAVRIYRVKVRGDCPISSHPYVTDVDGVAVDIPDRTWVGGPVGEHADIEYDTSHLRPGRWTLYVHGAYLCPGGVIKQFMQPSVNFRVVP